MPSQDLIKVSVVVNDQPLREYLASDLPIDEPHTLTRYIEATTGLQFKVVVSFGKGFKPYHAEVLHAIINLDDCVDDHYMFSDPIEKRHVPLRNSVVLNREDVPLIDEDTNIWHQCPFTFGALDEDVGSSPGIDAATLAQLGTIRVTCFRARMVKREIPYQWHGCKPQTIDEVPEKLLKGNILKNNIKYAEGEPCWEPELQTHDFVPISGRHGVKYHFNFRYRNRKILQSMGCIPRTPSPAPDFQTMLVRTEAMLQEEKAKLRRVMRETEELRKEVTRYRSHTFESDNGSEPEKSTTIKQQSSHHSLKRTRENDDDDDLCELPPPPKKSKIVIQLD